jgi:hypothetical protein
MKTFIAISAGVLVFVLTVVAISLTRAVTGFQPARLGATLGTAYTWLCAFAAFMAARWAFRKMKPARPKVANGPLSGAGKETP